MTVRFFFFPSARTHDRSFLSLLASSHFSSPGFRRRTVGELHVFPRCRGETEIQLFWQLARVNKDIALLSSISSALSNLKHDESTLSSFPTSSLSNPHASPLFHEGCIYSVVYTPNIHNPSLSFWNRISGDRNILRREKNYLMSLL